MHEQDHRAEIERMLRDILAEAKFSRSYTGLEELSPNILQAMSQVPRHEFVPRQQQWRSYEDSALAIGSGQTISQPFIVALMTQLLEPRLQDVMLEIGTGSGYQAAVLSRLVARVYSVEIIEELAREARETLRRLGCDNVEVRHGDGHAGWPEHAPYDGIIVTAAASYIPQALLDQLKPGRRLIIPLGDDFGFQQLTVVQKNTDGAVERQAVLPVAFVPFTGEEAPHRR